MTISNIRTRFKCCSPAFLLALLVACGGSSDPSTSDSNTPRTYVWSNPIAQAAFTGRDGAGMVELNGKLFLLGGWRWDSAGDLTDFNVTSAVGCCTTSEVWSSPDGVNWSMEGVAPWPSRHMAGWAVMNGAIYVVGGDDNNGFYDTDVWSSTDGRSWQQLTSSLPFPLRALQYVVSFNGALWVMGGQELPALLDPLPMPYPATQTLYSDVWRSTDGVNWTQVGNMPWALGMICGSAVFDGQLWVIGGGRYGDDTQEIAGVAYAEVWSTSDGVNWTEHATAPWAVRRYHNVVVFDNKLFVMAGIGSDGSNDKNDVWYSADGDTWTEMPSTPWVERHAASAAVLNGALYITGGTDNGQVQHNDVWQLQVESM